MIINAVMPMLHTTISLIFACFLGVTGHIDNFQPYKDAMMVQHDLNFSFQLGGFCYVYDVSKYHIYIDDDWLIRHEYGHYRQEKMLRGAYLFIIGIPSVLLALSPITTQRYMNSWPELWATELGFED